MSDQNEVVFVKYPKQLIAITKRELLQLLYTNPDLYRQCLTRGKRHRRESRFEQPNRSHAGGNPNSTAGNP